jgi:peptidoglycan/LPS O-acetylase OafA/YrhL
MSPEKIGTKRLSNLDYLRGLAAFGIMIYHFSSWQSKDLSAHTFLGRIGIYGVALFYVLSGLTLYYVYNDRMRPLKNGIENFLKHRFFRIFPLMWFATIATIILSRQLPNFLKLFLNLTGLFGFVRWDDYYAVGLWSIGNELVFYVFFIILIFSLQKSRLLFFFAATGFFTVFLYFSFFILNDKINLADQWTTYVNPMNHAFLFVGGFLIGMIKIKIPAWANLTLLTLAILTFTLYPVRGSDQILLVTGYTRLIFTACCFLIVLCFYKLEVAPPAFVHKPLSRLGEASYSVYLLHPLVYTSLNIAFNSNLLLVASITVFISYFVYQYFEKYFMALGKRKQFSLFNRLESKKSKSKIASSELTLTFDS